MQSLTIDSPIGPITLEAEGETLTAVRFGASRRPNVAGGAALRAARTQLEEYFAGLRREFDLALAPAGTEFQRRIWRTLVRIPFGATWSYTELAARAGRAGAVRAAGAANGRNPFAIVVPCHRVIGADGTLTGYGGGLDAKRWLLEHEARVASRSVRRA